MTVERFRLLVAKCPDIVLRGDIAAALAQEVSRTPVAFRRFYDNVVDEIRLAALPGHDARRSL